MNQPRGQQKSMTPSTPTVVTERRGEITVIMINRPAVRNAVDGPTARLLAQAFRAFDADPTQSVAILTGADGHFCAGADLSALAEPERTRVNDLNHDGDGPMGPTRMLLSKPVIAAISGYCVAGGIELAAWCDLRVADPTAVLGVFCRRFGVPLIDGGTVRLPRLIGMSRAMDLILTGREVSAQEALDIGLINRLAPNALQAAIELAQQIAAAPPHCMRHDRLSAYEQWSLPVDQALAREFDWGMKTLQAGEAFAGAKQFTEGLGRHGTPVDNTALPT